MNEIQEEIDRINSILDSGGSIPDNNNVWFEINIDELDLPSGFINVGSIIRDGHFDLIYSLLKPSSFLMINLTNNLDQELAYILKNKKVCDISGIEITTTSDEGNLFVSTIDTKETGTVMYMVPKAGKTLDAERVLNLLTILTIKFDTEVEKGRRPYVNRTTESGFITKEDMENKHNTVMFRTLN